MNYPDVTEKLSAPAASTPASGYTDGCGEPIRHGDACPKCHGVVVWEEAEDEAGHDLKCNECGHIYKSV